MPQPARRSGGGNAVEISLSAREQSEPSKKLVVAHFMVGNTYPYTAEDWREDITLAHSHGIDAFALNVGNEEWQRRSVARCYAAAAEMETTFRLFLSFDMAAIKADSAEDVNVLRDYVAGVAGHPNQLLYDGKILVSTFAGQDSLFGYSTLNDAWMFVKDVLHEVAPVHFAPSFFINPEYYPHLSSMDGYFNWNGGWPIQLSRDSSKEEVVCPKLTTDHHHIHHLGGRTFMAAVSPWFFTHYGPDSWNKNWVYRGDDWLFVRRWEQLIAERDQVDIVQVISWNDYGESHYIGPIRGAQPNSQAWVDGFPHEPWLELNAYFARAFKEGAYPPIERDRIFMWSRPHLKEAEATDDTAPRPDNWELLDDRFWVVVFATKPTEVYLYAASDRPPQVSTIGEGISKLSHPMVVGASMKATMVRNGVVIAECDPEREGFRVQDVPRTYNFNAFVAMSA